MHQRPYMLPRVHSLTSGICLGHGLVVLCPNMLYPDMPLQHHAATQARVQRHSATSQQMVRLCPAGDSFDIESEISSMTSHGSFMSVVRAAKLAADQVDSPTYLQSGDADVQRARDQVDRIHQVHASPACPSVLEAGFISVNENLPHVCKAVLVSQLLHHQHLQSSQFLSENG